MPNLTDHVLQGICLYSSRNPLWPSPALLVGAGGETKSTSWRKKWFLLCKRLTLRGWLLKTRCTYYFEAVQGAEVRWVQAWATVDVESGEVPAAGLVAWEHIHVHFYTTSPPPEDPSVPIVHFFVTSFKGRGQQVKTRVHELCCRFCKIKGTFSEQKSQGNVDKMLVLLTMSCGPGPRNGQPQ